MLQQNEPTSSPMDKEKYRLDPKKSQEPPYHVRQEMSAEQTNCQKNTVSNTQSFLVSGRASESTPIAEKNNLNCNT